MNTLTEICQAKKAHVTRKKRETPEARLLATAMHAGAPRGFCTALQSRLEAGGFGLIAEVKKASPSKGVIRAHFDPPTLAKDYENGGASCLSVLTDEPYFQGQDSFLQAAHTACLLPVLRKDFMIDPYQIIESRALEADCVLLIMAALSDAQAEELFHAADSLHLDVLVEVHDERELDRACTRLPLKMLGINNRDLRSFSTDLAVSERLSAYIPKGVLGISESGIHNHADLLRLQRSGIECFLVGESLMRKENVEEATRSLLFGHIRD